MTDPSDLLRRASELTDRADHEEDIEIRDRLLRMAAHYVHIAESEEWLAAHPTSIASVTEVLNKSDLEQPGRPVCSATLELTTSTMPAGVKTTPVDR